MSNRKTYRYKNLSVPVEDNTEVNFSVDFISDVNTSYTLVDIPGDNNPDIDDEGTANLGKGSTLRSEKTIVVCDVDNLAHQEDRIKINFLINDEVIVAFDKPKSEEDRPIIILKINFPES
ncbi:MAG: hypothetical protein BalsKO_00010 [Balneolaceae bacterium]